MSANMKDDNIEMTNELEEEVEENTYEVEAITDKKKTGGKWKYRVKWVGYPDSDSTWEPLENLQNLDEMLQEFEEQFERRQKLKESQTHKQIQLTGRTNIHNLGSSLKKSTGNNSQLSLSQVETNSSLNKDKKKVQPKEKEKIPLYQEPKLKKKRKLVEKEKSSSESEKNGQDSNKNSSNSSHTDSKSTNQNNLTNNPSSIPSINPIKKNTRDDPIVIGEEEDTPPKVFGCFESQDLPKRLITARLMTPSNEVNCLVEWESRKCGIKPAETFVSNKVLREKCPQLLLDFYESRLRFPSNSGPSGSTK